ncbi:hypothetical protein U1Q18_044019 [Sarracenia purpurea var. burkii]
MGERNEFAIKRPEYLRLVYISDVKLVLVGDGLFFTLGKMTPRFLTVDDFIGVPACILILLGFRNGVEVVVVVDVVDIVGTDTLARCMSVAQQTPYKSAETPRI